MDVQDTPLAGVKVITPRVFPDPRGYFFESFNAKKFRDATDLEPTFAQDNQSSSTRGVLRGLHYQIQQPQGKLVRALSGEIYDVVVDLRRSSPTFGHWFGITLSGENKKQLWIPVGFAHGFLTLSETVTVAYKATDFYYAEGERAILWNDPDLAIDWPNDGEPDLSDKDAAATRFVDAETFP